MFEENDEDTEEDEEEDPNKFLKKKHGLVSLGQLLQGSSNDEEEEEADLDKSAAKNRQHTSVYIENTDSEDD